MMAARALPAVLMQCIHQASQLLFISQKDGKEFCLSALLCEQPEGLPIHPTESDSAVICHLAKI